METRTTILNFQPGTSIPVVHVSQYDVGVLLRFIIYDGAELANIESGSGTSVVVAATRPSGTGFSVPCTVVAPNIVEVSTTEAMAKEFGTMDAEVRYTRSGVSVGTGNFKFIVEPAAHADYIIDEDHAEWVRIAQEVASNRASAESAKQSAQQSATRAETAAASVAGEVDKAAAAAATAAAAKNDAVTAKDAAVTARGEALTAATNAATSASAAQAAADQAQSTLSNAVRYDVAQVKSADAMATARTNIGAASLAQLANPYSSSSTYAVGDLALYEAKLYKCTTAISSPESWTASHWTEAPISEGLASLKDDLSEIEYTAIPFISGSYIAISGTSADRNAPIKNSGYRYASLICQKGNRYLINADGGNLTKTYAFLDVDGNVIESSDSLEILTDRIITAPDNSYALIINDLINSDSGNSYSQKINDVQNGSVRYDVFQAKTVQERTLARKNAGINDLSLSPRIKWALINVLRRAYYESNLGGEFVSMLEIALNMGIRTKLEPTTFENADQKAYSDTGWNTSFSNSWRSNMFDVIGYDYLEYNDVRTYYRKVYNPSNDLQLYGITFLDNNNNYISHVNHENCDLITRVSGREDETPSVEKPIIHCDSSISGVVKIPKTASKVVVTNNVSVSAGVIIKRYIPKLYLCKTEA